MYRMASEVSMMNRLCEFVGVFKREHREELLSIVASGIDGNSGLSNATGLEVERHGAGSLRGTLRANTGEIL